MKLETLYRSLSLPPNPRTPEPPKPRSPEGLADETGLTIEVSRRVGTALVHQPP